MMSLYYIFIYYMPHAMLDRDKIDKIRIVTEFNVLFYYFSHSSTKPLLVSSIVRAFILF